VATLKFCLAELIEVLANILGRDMDQLKFKSARPSAQLRNFSTACKYAARVMRIANAAKEKLFAGEDSGPTGAGDDSRQKHSRSFRLRNRHEFVGHVPFPTALCSKSRQNYLT
jgi:hypothetical protein